MNGNLKVQVRISSTACCTVVAPTFSQLGRFYVGRQLGLIICMQFLPIPCQFQIGTVQQMIKRFREAPPRSRQERLLTQDEELPEMTHTPFWWQQVSAFANESY